MSAALSPAARALLAWLQERPAAGEGSLKSWGIKRRPQLTLTQVEVRAAELVEANLVTREVKADGRSIYRARERSPEPAPVEVTTEPELGWIPNTGAAGPFYGVDRSPEPKKKAGKSPIVYVNQCSVCGRKDGAPGRCAFCHELGHEEPEAPEPSPESPATKARKARSTCAQCDRYADTIVQLNRTCDHMAEALLSWERQWGPEGSDLMAMEARIQEAEKRAEQAEARVGDISEGNQDYRAQLIEARKRLHDVMDERDQLAAALAKAKATAPTPTPAEPALSALARLPVEQRRLVGLALQELSLEALGGALGAARAEAFAARPDLAPRLSENAAAVLEILHPDRGQTPREIGKKSGINQHSVHSALRSLEKHGLATNATYGFWRRAKS